MSKKQSIQSDFKVKIEDEAKALQDRYNLVYLFFFLMGLVHFIPWSFFTTSTEFWMYKFRNVSNPETTSENRTSLQSLFAASTNFTLQATDVIFLTLGIFFGHYLKIKQRIQGVLVILLVLFAILTVFVPINTDSYQTEFFGVTMTIVCTINALSALFSVTIYTILSNFPPSYLAPYLFSSPLSRVFTSSMEIVSLVFGLGVVDSALVYFSLGVAVIILSLAFAVYVVNFNEFFLANMEGFHEGGKEKVLSFAETKALFKKLWLIFVAYSFTTVVADSSPVALVVSEFEGTGRWADDFFVPTVTFLMAAVIEWVGRRASLMGKYEFSKGFFLLLSIVNFFVFFPLIILCNCQPRNHLPVIFQHDYQYIIIMIFYSFCKGYILNMCTMFIPKLVNKDELKNGYHFYLIFVGIILAVFSPVNLLVVELL